MPSNDMSESAAWAPGPLTNELLEVLDRLIVLLQRDNHDYWVDWIQHARSEIGSGDARGIRTLLSAYGGMGSFADLSISSYPDQKMQREEFFQLRSRARELARLIRNQLDSEGTR